MNKHQALQLIHLTTGYRRSGKDSFNESMVGWIIYRDPTNTAVYTPTGEHFAFADELRKEVIDKIGREYQVVVPWDSVSTGLKDHIVVGGRTLRDHLIELGQQRRREDVNYWVDRVLQAAKSYEQVKITDLRMGNEVNRCRSVAPVITYRVYRSDVPVPPYHPDPNEDTEHQLDAFKTDYLVLSTINRDHREEFKRALELFPQYESYIPTII